MDIYKRKLTTFFPLLIIENVRTEKKNEVTFSFQNFYFASILNTYKLD